MWQISPQALSSMMSHQVVCSDIGVSTSVPTLLIKSIQGAAAELCVTQLAAMTADRVTFGNSQVQGSIVDDTSPKQALPTPPHWHCQFLTHLEFKIQLCVQHNLSEAHAKSPSILDERHAQSVHHDL